MTAVLEILLLIVAIYVIFKSPWKWRTFARMLVAFVTVLLLSIIGSVFTRLGNPEVWGAVGRLLGLLVAIYVGWRHTRSLPHAKSEPSQPTPAKDQPESP